MTVPIFPCPECEAILDDPESGEHMTGIDGVVCPDCDEVVMPTRTLDQALVGDGGVPERRAEVVALAAAGCSYSEICERTEFSNRGDVSNQLSEYKSLLKQARWLSEYGPELE